MADQSKVEDQKSKAITPAASSLSFMTRMGNARVPVEVFDGTGHFGMWQSDVLDALLQQGLEIALEKEKPDTVDETEWRTLNRFACSTIRICLSKEQRYAFAKETSASTMMKALEDKFLKKTSQNKLHLKQRLFRFTYAPGTTLNDHITSFNQLVADLLNVDVTFGDEDLALMLLGSLPEEYEFLEKLYFMGRKLCLSVKCAVPYTVMNCGGKARKKAQVELQKLL